MRAVKALKVRANPPAVPLNQVNADKFTSAANQFNAFGNQVEAFRASGKLTDGQADELLDTLEALPQWEQAGGDRPAEIAKRRACPSAALKNEPHAGVPRGKGTILREDRHFQGKCRCPCLPRRLYGIHRRSDSSMPARIAAESPLIHVVFRWFPFADREHASTEVGTSTTGFLLL